MQIRLFIFSLLLLHYKELVAQKYYTKIIDFDSLSQSSQQIVEHNGGFLLGYYQTCSDLESQCSGIVRVDTDGNIKDKVLLEKFSNNPNSILIDDNKLLLTGEKYNSTVDAHEFLINQLDINSLDSLETYEVSDKKRPLVFLFQLDNTVWNNKYVIAGNGRLAENKPNKATIYIVNRNLKLDTMIYINLSSGNINPWEVYVDHNNFLTIHIQYDDWTTKETFSTIMKYDKSYNLVWQWTSINDATQRALPYGCELNNGNIAINFTDKLSDNMNVVHIIKPDSTIANISKWPGGYSGQGRFIDRLRVAKNGDILGCGRYGDLLDQNLRFVRVPFIFRMSPQGQLLWYKVYYKEQFYENGDLVQGGFSDVIETSTGDLMAVGRIHNLLDYDPKVQGPRKDWDILLAKFDANGCQEPDCGIINKIDYKTATSEPIASQMENISIYPNPFFDGNLTIDINSEKQNSYTIIVYNSIGQIIKKQLAINGKNSITLVHKGIVFIEVLKENRQVYYRKAVGY